MVCPKCFHDSPGEVQYCTRCHATLYFTCPKCFCKQYHGGTCDECGANFEQYQAVYLAGIIGESARETQKEADKVGRVMSATQIAISAATSPWTAVLVLTRTILFRLLRPS